MHKPALAQPIVFHKPNNSIDFNKFLPQSPKATFTTKLRLHNSQPFNLELPLVLSELNDPPLQKGLSLTTRHRNIPMLNPNCVYTSKKITSKELKEENTMRKDKVDVLLYELRKLDEVSIANAQEIQEKDLLERKRRNRAEFQKRSFMLFGKILCLYQLNYEISFGISSDSFLDIDGVSNNFELIEPMKDLASVFARFPYSFFRKLRMPVITFCDDVFFHKSSMIAFCESRVVAKNLIPIKKLDTHEKIVNHVIQIIHYHLRCNFPELEIKLLKTGEEKVRSTSNINTMRQTEHHFKIKKKNPSEKDWMVLKALIINPKEVLANRNEVIKQKGKVFKSFLEKLDPEGINYRWWAKYGYAPAE